MADFTAAELLEAKRSIASTLSKCEKALEKLSPGRPQHTLTLRRIAAFRLSLALIDQALAAPEGPPSDAPSPGGGQSSGAKEKRADPKH